MSEDGGSDADDGGAFLDGHAVVTAHAHGEFRQCGAARVLDAVPKLPETAKNLPELFLRSLEGGHGHQPRQRSGCIDGKGLCQFQRFVGCQAEFAFLTGDVDFQKKFRMDGEFGGNDLDAMQELRRVHRVDPTGKLQSCPNFVLLQMTNQMPLDLSGQDLAFLRQFLDAVLAEALLPRQKDFLDIFCRESLGDSQKTDGARIPAGVHGGLRHILLDPMKILKKLSHETTGKIEERDYLILCDKNNKINPQQESSCNMPEKEAQDNLLASKRHFATSDERRQDALVAQWVGEERAPGVLGIFHKRMKSIGECVDQFLGRIHQDDVLILERLRESWEEVLGVETSRQLFPLEIRGRCLVMEAVNQTYLFVFRNPQVKDPVLKRLSEFTNGRVDDCKVVSPGRR